VARDINTGRHLTLSATFPRMSAGFLSKAYQSVGAKNVMTLYDAWADSYDAELTQNGYATPARCARALAAVVSDKTRPVLDFGCGTGLSGQALRAARFNTIDGIDISADMLAQADTTNVYRSLTRFKPNEPLPFEQGAYDAIAAIGVIGVGAAPIGVFYDLMNALPTGGKLVFSFNDHTLADPVHEAAISEWLDMGAAILTSKEHGPHLPKINMSSTVYVIEKA
jgi:predicted TPR repeat methyltransferase